MAAQRRALRKSVPVLREFAAPAAAAALGGDNEALSSLDRRPSAGTSAIVRRNRRVAAETRMERIKAQPSPARW